MKTFRGKILYWFTLILVFALTLVFLTYTNKNHIKNWLLGYRSVEINSTTLSVRDLGEGFPAVIIVSGMACNQDLYNELQITLAKTTRVITFDRPGIGRSPENNEPKTLPFIDADLKALLTKLKVSPPYILIGHSLGGHIIRYYANQRPEEVAGLVFLDHPHEDWFKYIHTTWTKSDVESYFRFWSKENPNYSGARQKELLAYEENCDLIRGVSINPKTPVLMFTANNIGHFRKDQIGQTEDRKMYLDLQSSLLNKLIDAEHIVDWEMGHTLHRDKPHMVAEKIKSFIEKLQSQSIDKEDLIE